MKTLKTLIILALILGSFTATFGQTGSAAERFTQAKEAFDNSQFEKTLTLLDAMEKDFGKSPRIESLRALTLRDLNRPRDAYLSVLAYFKLVEGKDLSDNVAHKSLIELRDTLKAQLETDLSVKKDNLQAERNANADKAISETDTRSVQNTQSSTTADPLAELEMWNKVKTSTNASDYYLFLQRFPAGSFAKQAQAKMNEIGDPVWNEVKKSKDPFVYRDFLAKNTNSPFAVEAREKMTMLTASVIAWEQIKDTKTNSEVLDYLRKYPNGSNADDARKIVASNLLSEFWSFFPTQYTAPGNPDYHISAKLISIEGCKLSISAQYIETSGYTDSHIDELTLDLMNAYNASFEDMSYDAGQDYSVTIISSQKPFLTKRTNFKKANLGKVRNTESKEEASFGFRFNNLRVAKNFHSKIEQVINLCQNASN